MVVNNVKAVFNQQYGFCKLFIIQLCYINRTNCISAATWRNSDTAIKRLRCTKENFYTHLIPPLENDDFYRDTPIFACKFSPQEGNEHLVALANEEGKLAIHDSSTNTRYVHIMVLNKYKLKIVKISSLMNKI